MSFKIGDRVRITNCGAVYSTHKLIADFLGALNWEDGRGRDSGHLKNGMLGEITNIDGFKFLIRMEDGYDYIMALGSFKLVEEDDIIRVGDLVEPIPVEELPSILKSLGNINMQKILLANHVWPKVVEEITTENYPRIYFEGDRREWYNGLYLARFRKVRTNDPNRKYIKVITKIREIKKRRESLGYKY